MKVISAFVLSLWCSASWAQSEVFLCIDKSGKKFYDNKVRQGADCKKVDLPGITTPVPPPKPINFSAAKIGMSADKVYADVGSPASRRRVETREGITERWSYPGGRSLTFKNGILEMIEQ